MKSKNYIYIILVVIVIIFHEFILAMGYMIYTTSKYIVTDAIPETFNNIVYSGNNMKAYNKYIKNNYGIVSETFELKSHYNRFWYVSTPFMEKEFSLQIVKGKVIGNTFSTTLTTDPKFQHLYSEWVKKQVGIEDENVELKFAGNYDTPYIEFNKITHLSDDYREVFENTHNLYLMEVWEKNIINLSKNNWRMYVSEHLVYFDKLKSLVKLNPLCNDNGYFVCLYKYGQDKYNVKDREKYYGTFDEPNNIDTAIINNSIYEDKAEFEQFENGKIKKYVINEYGDIIK